MVFRAGCLGSWGVTGLMLLGAIAVFLLATVFNDCAKDRLPWKCVAWSEVERYERQMKADLPRGTSQRDVENYLRREGIPFSHLAPISPSQQRPIGIWQNFPVGWFGAIEIRITFDASGGVDGIEARRTKIERPR